MLYVGRCATCSCRLPQRRSATGSRLPTAPSSSVTSGCTREITMAAATTNSDNNNSPPGDSPANHCTAHLDVSRDSGDVTPDHQSSRSRPSPGGKRPRKATSASSRSAGRPLPGHGATVDLTGQPRTAPPAAGKLSLSATSSPASVTLVPGGTASVSNTSRKQTSLSTVSTSLTDIASKTESGGKATITSSRLAMPRSSGRPPKTVRPASDGGGTTTTASESYRGLGSKLPSVATGSAGAISALTSFHSGSRKQQQPQRTSKSSDHHRPVASTSSPSSGRLTELRVHFGLGHDTERVVPADLPSPTACGASSTTHGVTDDSESLPTRPEHCHSFPDQQSLPEDQSLNVATNEQKDCQSLEHGYVDHLNAADWQSDYQNVPDEKDHKILPDGQVHRQNISGDHEHHQSLLDAQDNRNVLTGGHKIGQILPYWQGDDERFADTQEDCTNLIERHEHRQSFSEKEATLVNQESPELRCVLSVSENNQQLMIRECADASPACNDIDRTSACEDDDATCDATSYSDAELDKRVDYPPSTTSTSSVVITRDATGSTTYSHPTTVSGTDKSS